MTNEQPPTFTPLIPTEISELSAMVSKLFTSKDAPPWLKPVQVERAVLEIRAWRAMHP